MEVKLDQIRLLRDLKKLQGTLNDLPEQARTRILGAAALEMAKVAKGTARRIVRVRTGRLKRSITVKRMVVRGPDGSKRKGARLKAGAGWARHAHLIEYGWTDRRTGKRAGPFPFIRPALEQHQGRMIKAAKGRVQRLLPRAVKAAKRKAASIGG